MDEEKLILDNINLIYKVMSDLHLYYRNEDEKDEYFCAGVCGLINGVRTWNGHEYSLSSYLYVCIKNEILHVLVLAGCNKRKVYRENILSLDTVLGDYTLDTYQDVLEDTSINIEEDVMMSDLMEKIADVVDIYFPKMQRLYMYHYYGLRNTPQMTTVEIAKKYHCSTHNVLGRIKEGRIKLKKLMKEYYGEW